jgi:hypothetical protein
MAHAICPPLGHRSKTEQLPFYAMGVIDSNRARFDETIPRDALTLANQSD